MRAKTIRKITVLFTVPLGAAIGLGVAYLSVILILSPLIRFVGHHWLRTPLGLVGVVLPIACVWYGVNRGIEIPARYIWDDQDLR